MRLLKNQEARIKKATEPRIQRSSPIIIYLYSNHRESDVSKPASLYALFHSHAFLRMDGIESLVCELAMSRFYYFPRHACCPIFFLKAWSDVQRGRCTKYCARTHYVRVSTQTDPPHDYTDPPHLYTAMFRATSAARVLASNSKKVREDSNDSYRC